MIIANVTISHAIDMMENCVRVLTMESVFVENVNAMPNGMYPDTLLANVRPLMKHVSLLTENTFTNCVLDMVHVNVESANVSRQKKVNILEDTAKTVL